MNTDQHPEDFPEVQTAIYRVALALDSFLLNGIPYGVIHRDVFNGFLEKTAGNLRVELTRLEEYAAHASAIRQVEATAVLAALKARCQQLIDLVTELYLFRTFPLEQLRFTVSQVSFLHGECVRLIQELENRFRIQQPFYESRPGHSMVSMNDFLTNLEYTLVEQRAASGKEYKGTALQP
jgi:hypothetical protein